MTTHIEFLEALEDAPAVVRDELIRVKRLNETLATQLVQSESAQRNLRTNLEWLTTDLNRRITLQSEQLVTCRVNRALLKIELRREREAHNTTRNFTAHQQARIEVLLEQTRD